MYLFPVGYFLLHTPHWLLLARPYSLWQDCECYFDRMGGADKMMLHDDHHEKDHDDDGTPVALGAGFGGIFGGSTSNK